MSNIKERNNKIRKAGIATRLKRSSQICKTFKFKIPTNRLNSEQKTCLKMMFVEAKWIYNYLLSNTDQVYDIVSNYKNLNVITHLDKDKNEVKSNITHILSSARQELMQQIANQIKGLTKLKEKGHEVGRLKYKSDFKSIKFKQYGVTHIFKGNKLKIQGIKQYIPLLGLKQIRKYGSNIDFTTMNLIKEVDDYYVCLTCYIDKDDRKTSYIRDKIGIDLGIETNLTLSNGEKINCIVEESERTKRLQSKIARCKKGSNNRYKLRKKLERSYIKDRNRREDLTNKIVSRLIKENRIIVIQDDNLNKMKNNKSGSKTSNMIQHSILGRVKAKLKQKKNIVWLDRWCPTTQYCSICGAKTKHKLDKRTFVCKKCGHTEDRDIHAANNMLFMFESYAKSKEINTSQELAGVLTTIKWSDLSKSLSPLV